MALICLITNQLQTVRAVGISMKLIYQEHSLRSTNTFKIEHGQKRGKKREKILQFHNVEAFYLPSCGRTIGSGNKQAPVDRCKLSVAVLMSSPLSHRHAVFRQ